MPISQNLVTVISILAPTIVAVVTPLVTLRINTINKEYEIRVKSLEKQYDLFETKRQEMIAFIDQYSELASKLIDKLEKDELDNADTMMIIQLGLVTSSHGDYSSIIDDLQSYQSALEEQSYGLNGLRNLLSSSIQDSFTGLATELATISRLQYEILEELRELKVSFLKSLCLRNKDLQKSQEQSKRRKEYLDHS